jgi:hypothetical protein
MITRFYTVDGGFERKAATLRTKLVSLRFLALPDYSQNQTAISNALHLLYGF